MSDVLARLTTALAGRYALDRELGSGGMATVYLAEDVKHRRQVAVKVLRPELAAVLGAERFLKEIEVTANLQHPNILPLYDSGEAESFLYYVMPFVEGESLRGRLDREKQLGVDETLEIASSVAAALSQAHAHGVIHRDIKPANILFQAGQAVVADFGIALAVSHAGGSRLTETGLSVGTPQYMSPEQATGDRDLDARSDVYSLGAVVYEMLTGDPPYAGNTVQAIVGKVLTERPPPISQTRDTVPANVEAAVYKALAKTPADRFTTVAQFAEALTNPAVTVGLRSHPAAVGGRTRVVTRLAWPGAAVVAVMLAVWGWTRPQPSVPVVRSEISLPEGQRIAMTGGGSFPLAISRDGARLAYLGEQGGVRQLYLRNVDDFTVQPLPGTEGARQPFFSPDGQWVGFFADGSMHRVSVFGGAPIAIAPLPPGRTEGASWGADGSVLFGAGAGLYRVPAAGGDPVELTTTLVSQQADRTGADPTSNNLIPGGRKRWPHHLPGGHHALVTIPEGTGVLDLENGEIRYLFSGVQARYLPTGHLVYHAGQERVRLVPFDVGRQEITGPESPALENVFRGPGSGAAQFVISETGTLVYVTGGFERSLWLVDRDGRESPIAIDSRGYRFPKVSPDGKRVAVIVDPRPSSVWLIELQRTSAVPITNDQHHVTVGWAPDGERLAFTLAGDVHWINWREGGESHRATRPLTQYSPSWSRDNRIVVFERAPETGADLITLDLDDSTSTTFLATPADEWLPSMSPDGRWVAYTSNVSGVEEVYVRPFPGPGPQHSVSVGGGTDAAWSRDGRELFYRTGNRIVAVEVRTSPTFAADRPRDLFAGPYDFSQTNNWDVGPDGRFVMIKGDPTAFRRLQVVSNWFEELR